MKAAIHIAEITGPYVFQPDAEDPYYHYHAVKWIATDIPRSNFAPEMLLAFSAQAVIYPITRRDAEERVRAMATAGWKSAGGSPPPKVKHEEDEDGEGEPDLEELARDRIAKLIIIRFKGHGMARLVDALLKAQGYFTFCSPEGPDKGVDILAAFGPIGFGRSETRGPGQVR